MQQQKSVKQEQTMSLLDQTLQAIQDRVAFFASQSISAENYLNPNQNCSVRSISEVVTVLKAYEIIESPLNMNLSSIYINDQNKQGIRWNIPPASEGEDSINEEEVFEPSFKWLTSAFVDPNLLTVDQPEAVKIQRHKIPEDWAPVTSLLLFNVSKKIYFKSQILAIESSIKRKFNDRYFWFKFKRAKQIYFRGKPCLLLKCSDPNSAGFLYYNYVNYKANREEFGEQCEVFRVLKDKTKEYESQKNWILLFFRHLPLVMTKEQLMGILNANGEVKWMEELIEIEGAKYTCCRVSYLEEALHVCELFNARKIKEAKVNIHPKNSKSWKASQVIQSQIVGENPELQGAHIDLNLSY